MDYIKRILNAAKVQRRADRKSGLSIAYQHALATLKDQESIEAEMLELDTDSDEGRVRRDLLQQAMTEVVKRHEGFLKESAKILSLVADSDDPALTVSTLTAERLAAMLTHS